MAILYKFPFDQFGNSTTNAVINEEHVVQASDPHVLVPREGVFYTHAMKVINRATGLPLTVNADYKYVVPDFSVSAETGLEAAVGIQLTNGVFAGIITLEYQAVGGPQGQGNAMVQSLTSAINTAITNPQVSWYEIIDRPAYFPPELHTHPPSQIDDIDGLRMKFQDLTEAIRDRKPLKDSYHDLNEQSQRTLRLISQLRKSINDIVAVTGSAAVITQLQTDILSLASQLDLDVTILAGLPTELKAWPTGGFQRANGVIAFRGASMTHSVNVDIAHDGTDTLFTRHGEMKTGDALFNLSLAESSGMVRLNLTSNVLGEVKVKWTAIL